MISKLNSATYGRPGVVSLSVKAIHEAGHAVIARKLGLSCGSVTLGPHPFGAHAVIARRFYPKRTATQAEADTAFAIAMYAGREAECLICDQPTPRHERTDRTDRELAAGAIGDDPALQAELRRRARALVREHRETIEWFATALLQSGTLISLEADAVVAQFSACGEHWLHEL